MSEQLTGTSELQGKITEDDLAKFFLVTLYNSEGGPVRSWLTKADMASGQAMTKSFTDIRTGTKVVIGGSFVAETFGSVEELQHFYEKGVLVEKAA